MNKQTENKRDLDFELQQNINLRSVVGNKHAVEVATAYIEQFYNNPDMNLQPILLIGQSGCKTFAQAISNTFGNDAFRFVCSSFFAANCLDLGSYFAGGDYCSTNFIARIDKLDTSSQYKLWRILNEKRINYIDADTKAPVNAPLGNGLHIYSAANTNAIIKPLLDQMGIIIILSALNESEIVQVLKQRAKLMDLAFSSDDLFDKIVQGCSGRIDKAVELFSLACCLMRAEDANCLIEKHVSRALYLDEENTKALH